MIMATGSWFRYIVGIVLSLDVVRTALTGGELQVTTIGLSIVFLLLALLYLVKGV